MRYGFVPSEMPRMRSRRPWRKPQPDLRTAGTASSSSWPPSWRPMDSDLGLVRGSLHDDVRDAGHLISMWVALEARRQGVGSALIDAVVQWASTRGLSRLLLDVVETNTSAIGVYARKGFVPNGEVGTLPPPRDHVREIQLVMKL